jgi:hypothetical protein
MLGNQRGLRTLMETFDTQTIAALVEDNQLDQAAGSINARYRETSVEILSVFEDLLTILSEPSFLGDLRNFRHLAHLGRPSAKTLLQNFLADTRVQNCLTAVLRSLEESVPVSVYLGFATIPKHFRETDFFHVYRADVINYEAEYSLLTETRLVHLLSSAPNVLDLSLLDEDTRAGKEKVLRSYRKESLAPVRRAFGETLSRCGDFFVLLEEFADNFRKFFERFRDSGYRPDDGNRAEWMSLGDDYFHLELSKSSLMLPIRPQALYWGMQKEYPETLARLEKLRTMTTPDFIISDPERSDGSWQTTIECRNPQALDDPVFLIEVLHRYGDGGLSPGENVRSQLVPLEEGRRYRYVIERPPGNGSASLSLRVTGKARFFQLPFVVEKILQIS